MGKNKNKKINKNKKKKGEKKTSFSESTQVGIYNKVESLVCEIKSQYYKRNDTIAEIKPVFGLEEGDEECVVCYANPRSTVLHPCTHMAVCMECLQKLKKCPVCRAKIKGFIQLNTNASKKNK